MVMMRSVPASRGATTPGARSRARRDRHVVVLLGTILWTGCSGGGEGVTDLSLEGPSTSVVMTTDPAVPTDPPGVTSTVSATVPSTIEVLPTPSGPATPLPDEADAVVAGYLMAWQAFHDAAKDPTDLVLVERVRATTAGPNRDLSLSILEHLALHGRVARSNPDAPEGVAVESPVEFLDGERSRARIVVCERNHEIVWEPGGAPDGSDALINDEVVARRIEVELRRVDGRWLSYTGLEVQTWPGHEFCPPL
jgi:hypothetical protein